MNKSAFKKPLKIAGYTFAAFVGLLLIITLIINFGPVQDKIVLKATQALQEKIPTKVHIDKIQVNLISQAVSLQGVEVEDLQHRKMLQLEEISADLKFLPLFMGKIILKGGEANGLKALIVKPSKEEPANYQFLIDAFKKKDDKGEKKKEKKQNSAKRFAVDLSHLQIYDINVKYNDYDIQLERGSYTKELSGNQFVILQDGEAKWDATTKKGREARTVGIGLLSAVLTDTGEKLVTLRDFRYQTNNHKPRKNAHKPKRGFFDMGHLDITADLKVTLNHISKDSINATITKGFAYDSIMGMDFKDLRFNIAANKRKAHITDLSVLQKSTSLRVTEADINFPDKAKGTGLTYSAKNITGKAFLTDISRPFAPVLSNFKLPLLLNLRLTGSANTMEFRNVRVYTEDRKFVCASTGIMRNMNDAQKLTLHFEVIDMVAKPGIKDKLINQFPVKKFMMRQLFALGTLRYHGSFDILWKKEIFRGRLNTEVGNINFEFGIDNEEKYLTGTVSTKDVIMGKLFEVKDLGAIDCQADFKIDISKARTLKMRQQKSGKLPIGSVTAQINDCVYKTSHFRDLYATINSDGALAEGNAELRGKHTALVVNFSLTNTEQMSKMKIKPGLKFMEIAQ